MAHSRDLKEASVLTSTKYSGLYQNGVIYLCVLSPLFIISAMAALEACPVTGLEDEGKPMKWLEAVVLEKWK